MERETKSEAEQIVDFRNRELTWKDWAIVVAMNVVALVVLSAIVSVAKS